MSEVGSADFRFEDVLFKLSEAEGSDCHFEDVVPDLQTSYDAAVSAFRDATTAAGEAFELAVDAARKRKDLAKSHHQSELAAMEMQLARCCDAFSANPREFSGIYKASPPDLKELKASECKYDSSLKEYKAACRAVLTARELAQKHYDEAMAIAAHELRQAWFPPRYSQATAYSDNFQKLVLEQTYSREDVLTALCGYSEVQDIDFDGDLSAFQASLAKAWSRGPLCHDVNRCLYQDDAKQMNLLAPYIQHFREAFRGLHPSCRGVLRPFDGLLFRYMHLREGELDKYQQDCSIVWPTFSSCTYDEAWLKSSLSGDSAEFEIRSYGAAEASASKEANGLYLPCLIEEHVLSRYVYQKEVVMPPFCSFRVVNVNKTTASFWTAKPRRTRVFLETTQFPSVWQSIAAGQADEFAKWARKNEGLVSMSGNDISIVNEIAKAAAKAVEQPAAETVDRLGAAHDMFRACAEMGAPLSEVDPETGSTAVFTIAESLVGLKSSTEAVKESLKSMIKGMARSGANVTIPHEGRRLADLLPDLAKELEKETLLGSKWQYWVDDGIHGKSDGWYDYDAQAWQAVSRAYDDWLRDGSVPAMTVKSGWYTYKVSFGEMMQENISTRKRRNIRRMVVESSSGYSAASAEVKCTIA